MKYVNDGVRRQDRLMDEERALELLREGEYGVLSMVLTTPVMASPSTSFGMVITVCISIVRQPEGSWKRLKRTLMYRYVSLVTSTCCRVTSPQNTRVRSSSDGLVYICRTKRRCTLYTFLSINYRQTSRKLAINTPTRVSIVWR